MGSISITTSGKGSLINIDTKEMLRYERMLQTFSQDGNKHAMRNTINNTAFIGMKEAREEVQDNYTVRNPWTPRSIAFRRSPDINNIEAAVGSTEEYMRLQEEGGERKPNAGSRSVPIPTGAASGEDGVNVSDRKRLPTGSNRFKAIRLSKVKANTRRGRNREGIRKAIKNKNKFVLLHTPKTLGIFKVTGSEDNNGKLKNIKLKMYYNMRKKSVKINPKPWLAPASQSAMKQMPSTYEREVFRQVERQLRR